MGATMGMGATRVVSLRASESLRRAWSIVCHGEPLHTAIYPSIHLGIPLIRNLTNFMHCTVGKNAQECKIFIAAVNYIVEGKVGTWRLLPGPTPPRPAPAMRVELNPPPALPASS